MQVKSTPILSGIVKHFLILENDSSLMLRIFSDGNTGMVFNNGDPLYRQECYAAAPEALPQSFIYGQLDVFQNVISTGKIKLLIAVLHPYGASALLRIPAFELKNQIIDTNTFPFLRSESVLDQMHDCTPLDKVRTVENFLISALHKPILNNALATKAIQLIDEHHGGMPVVRLASMLNVHERQLQRVFEEHIGVTPKRYSGIARIQYFLKLLRNRSSETTLTDALYTSGFYDPAHLNRELKSLSGLTPGQYMNGSNLLAANLIRLSQ
ncbi:helix-turn-helix domain-containing protein [Dyadobacter pollutisoli]|jgi:AraC-like DNA-binding protein|uniref:Helix-turn-helix domain-containing protein n=1 Tax=Dyadobacter pollutisoli TaxID=2910158 RepID=A0A9E8SIP9_9BACT|nr:helix-turn-helix domain-containing protein [Dyadobacter pollutisoli]WAC09359.1 helix-turn-helix domain-containing protein [Dyadobacter pollutisoli]